MMATAEELACRGRQLSGRDQFLHVLEELLDLFDG